MNRSGHGMADKLYAEVNRVTLDLRTLTDAADMLATQDDKTLTKLWHEAKLTQEICAAAKKAREVIGEFRSQQVDKLAPVGSREDHSA